MPIQGFILYIRLSFILVLMLGLSACSGNYEGNDFIFSAPAGFTIKSYEKPAIDSLYNGELLLFSNQGRLYFEILRQRIPPGSTLDAVFTSYLTRTRDVSSHYQLISQNTVQANGHTAIEYVHREFRGEPYVQLRELWIENNGQVFTLVCSEPVVSTPGAVIPVSDVCIQLATGFHFK